MAHLNDRLNSMLRSQGMDPSVVIDVQFIFSFPKLSPDEVYMECVAVAIDSAGKKHTGKSVRCQYDYEVLGA